MNIIVTGMIVSVPRQGGAAWAVLQYLLGLRRLGHHVTFIEPFVQNSRRPPRARLEDTVNAHEFHSILGQFGFLQDSSLLEVETLRSIGIPYTQLKVRARDADLLLNISGLLRLPELVQPVPLRVYVDLDPVFTQLWQASGEADMGFDLHNRFVTVGLNLGRRDCPIPTCDKEWITTLQPMVLEHWPQAPLEDVTLQAWTTIANWRSYGSIEWQGVHFGQKAHSWREFIDLPGRSLDAFAAALSIHPAESRDLRSLIEHGWKLLDPDEVTATPDDYRDFIRASRGELGIAKSGYVQANSGWFSDRSICYLASGRPVITQDTGLTGHLPLGDGLLAFSTMEELLQALDQVNRFYPRHAQAARALAESHFNSDKVLPRLLDL
ncbi:MAG TPA: glycosyltransferase [Acidobacteriota bacterium]|nr:glycosyltransferase [Acidobacteriota bacterium]